MRSAQDAEILAYQPTAKHRAMAAALLPEGSDPARVTELAVQLQQNELLREMVDQLRCIARRPA